MPKKNIAIITNLRHVGISTPIIETIKYFTSHHIGVHLYILRQSKDIDTLWENVEGLEVFDRMENRVRRFYNYVTDVKKNGPYLAVVNFDHESMIEFGLHMLFNPTYSIYHSLEINSRKERVYRGLGVILLMIHRVIINRSNLILTQDIVRRSLLSRIYGANEGRIKISPNSVIGKVDNRKNDYFQKMFMLREEDKIVLLTGSLINEHCIEELILSTDAWDPSHKLIIHGWFSNSSYKKRIVKLIHARPNSVFLSTTILNDKEKNVIFQSADIGLVFFKPINYNMKFAIGSAGKLYSFMQHGVPIISNQLPGAKELISSRLIGKVVNHYSEINRMIRAIDEEYKLFRDNCFSEFRKHEFSSMAKLNFHQIIRG